jgi:hypothetical protein
LQGNKEAKQYAHKWREATQRKKVKSKKNKKIEERLVRENIPASGP